MCTEEEYANRGAEGSELDVMKPPAKHYTYENYADRPDGVRAEIIDGCVIDLRPVFAGFDD